MHWRYVTQLSFHKGGYETTIHAQGRAPRNKKIRFQKHGIANCPACGGNYLHFRTV